MRWLFALPYAGACFAQDYNTAAQASLATREQTIARISTKADLEARQRYIKERILASIGGLPDSKTPLNARITGGFTRPGYRVENLVFESLPRFYVTANVYVPANGTAPFPAVIGVAGHSANGKASATYQHVWISLARRGFLVIAFDPPGQGERSATFDVETGTGRVSIGVNEHILEGTQCLLTGHHFARYEIWDGIRAVDYLLTRSDVDPKRIAVAGNSGGGTQAAYLAALEPRLAAIVSSCYMTSWRELWENPGPQDAEQVFPNFLRDQLDFGDFALAAAPRPFLLTAAIRDFFPIAGARRTADEIRRMYRVLDVEAKAGFFEHDDTHGWSQPRREAAYRWLAKWMQGREDTAAEGDVVTEPEQLLYATKTGQVKTDLGGETIQSINAAEARSMYAKRAPLTPEGVGKMIVMPSAASSRTAAVIWVGPRDDDFAQLTKAIPGVAILEMPKQPAQQSGYTDSWRLANRALLTGHTLLGDRVASLASIIPANGDAHIFAKGNGAVVGLHAAYLNRNVKTLVLQDMPLSYMAIAEAKYHRGLIDIVVPGALRHYDLPDLAAAIASRTSIAMVDTRHPNGSILPLDLVRASYPKAKLSHRPEGWMFDKVYSDFLNSSRTIR